MDTAEPSTNGTSARSLWRLGALLGDAAHAARARRTLHAFEAELQEVPHVYLGLLEAVVAEQLGWRTVVVAGPRGDAELEAQAGGLLAGGMNVCRAVARVGEGVEDEYLRRRNGALAGEGRRGVWVLEGGERRVVWGDE